MSKIYTFRARHTTDGTVSIEAETIQEAEAMRARLQENNAGVMNTEQGSGETFIDATGTEDSTPEDGTHYWTTPAENAKENAEALADLEGEAI